jgi:hypothetical protein
MELLRINSAAEYALNVFYYSVFAISAMRVFKQKFIKLVAVIVYA